VGGEKGLAALDDFAAVGLERIGCIVKGNAEQNTNEQIGQTINSQLQPRIVDDAPAFMKREPKTASQPSWSVCQ